MTVEAPETPRERMKVGVVLPVSEDGETGQTPRGAEAGRGPADLAVTVGVMIAYPVLGESAEETGEPRKALSGSTAEVAAGLREYERLGVSHAICYLDKIDATSLSWLAEALTVLHGTG